jgi:DNA polymerase II large subunit
MKDFPEYYKEYNKEIVRKLSESQDIAIKARKKLIDPSSRVETEIAFDLSDRVERMFNMNIGSRLRELLNENRNEYAALKLAEEIVLGKFGYYDNEESLNYGIRIGLAVVTDGVTIAPIQGISSVNIKKNNDDSKYISVSFAGPIRSAGGTEAAFTLIIADHLRKFMNLDRYKINCFGDDESGRILEELRIYEREVGNFQYKVSDEDIQNTLSYLPIEIDGVETDQVEVVVHRGLKRIKTDRLRGGALRVLNDGIIGRSRKLKNLLKNLGIKDWEWLEKLEGGSQETSEETRTEASHFQEVISGRPVISMPNRFGGFRLRYGRCYNTGLSAVGINPVLPIILDYPFVVGTQIKLNVPGKGGIITFVDSIEGPIVKLTDGTFTKVNSVEFAKKISKKIDKVIHLGDILISYGDFLENNINLLPSGYVEEWWSKDLIYNVKKNYIDLKRFSEKINIKFEKLNRIYSDPNYYYPSIEEAILLSKKLLIPLHPHYLFNWYSINISDILLLREKINIISYEIKSCIISLPNNSVFQGIIEKLGVPYKIEGSLLIIKGDDAYTIVFTLGLKNKVKLSHNWKNTEELLKQLSDVPIRNRESAYVGIRVGRPEKAMIRKMNPPVHVLFPIGNNGGNTRDIIKASKKDNIKVELINITCLKCGNKTIRKRCDKCGGETFIQKICPSCKRAIQKDMCVSCKINGIPYSEISVNIKEELRSAIKNLNYLPKSPLKGVKSLTNVTRIPEPIEKGILRKKYDVYIYKDGTARFDATNAPLTHFKPKQIDTSIELLRKIGYKKDINGKELKNDNQTLEIFVQDIILPYEGGNYLLKISNYIDELLKKLYKIDSYYNYNNKNDLIGQLVIGLAPHTSVGIIGRVIGYTNSQVCYAHPLWHSAKRRDCDGDEDSIILLLDSLINFSREYLPNQIGGLMDTPLLLQPIIIPKEVQRQAHNIDVVDNYSKKFYEFTLNNISPSEIIDEIDIIRKRLGNKNQYNEMKFTHNTNSITIDEERSRYTTLKTIKEKIKKQVDLAEKINAVNPSEVVQSVLNTHLLPDIIGNMKAYTSQTFRCKSCGEKYRRFPLKGNCLSCQGELQSTVTRASVAKYLDIASQLSEDYEVGEYLRNRLRLIKEEFVSLFPKEDEKQLELTAFLK